MTTQIIEPQNLVYKKPSLLNDSNMHYCPGCSHGVVHKIIAELIEEMGIADKAIGVAPVGCAVFAYKYIDIDWQEAAHGRAPALATAINRLVPGSMVFTYQGDGDLAAIGTAETIHACNRGENITIVRGNRCNGFILNTPCKVEIREQIPDIGMCADGVSLAGAEIYNTVGKLAGVVDSGAIIALDANKQAVARIIA